MTFSVITAPQNRLSVEWILNGETVEIQEKPRKTEKGLIKFTFTMDESINGWIRLNLRRDKKIMTITNPIYLK